MTGEILKDNNRLSGKFRELSIKNECALICYIIAGYPSKSTSEEIASCLVGAGADIIEIGIPFSDPIADGPVIEEASNTALMNGITPKDALEICSNIRKKFPHVPLIIMTYTNILLRAGLEDFLKRSKKCGVDGFILPDLPIEESEQYVNKTSELGLAAIFLISPNTDKGRMHYILEACSGFVYVVSVFGITGTRQRFENYTLETVRNIKQFTGRKLPVAVGFGISKPQHITSMINAGADGVIVGSAIIEKIKVSTNKRIMLNRLNIFVEQMKKVCKTKMINTSKD